MASVHTLTHLERDQDVDVLFGAAFRSLAPDGHLVLTCRDYERLPQGIVASKARPTPS